MGWSSIYFSILISLDEVLSPGNSYRCLRGKISNYFNLKIFKLLERTNPLVVFCFSCSIFSHLYSTFPFSRFHALTGIFLIRCDKVRWYHLNSPMGEVVFTLNFAVICWCKTSSQTKVFECQIFLLNTHYPTPYKGRAASPIYTAELRIHAVGGCGCCWRWILHTPSKGFMSFLKFSEKSGHQRLCGR